MFSQGVVFFVSFVLVTSTWQVPARACSPSLSRSVTSKSIEAQPMLSDDASCLQELATAYRTDAHFRFLNQCDDPLLVQSVECQGAHCISVTVEPDAFFDVNGGWDEDQDGGHRLSWRTGDRRGAMTLFVTYSSLRHAGSPCASDDSVCSQVNATRPVRWSWMSVFVLLLLCSVRRRAGKI